MPSEKSNSIIIYNSLTGKKEPFKTITKGYVGMYVCGPTVYSNVHLGNLRTFTSFDTIYRYLTHLGLKIRYVRNITDVGHMVDDNTEDRISEKARIEKIAPMEVVQKYTNDFHDTLKKFNLIPPSIEPTAQGHLIEQIELIKQMIDKKLAYEKNGSVYFDVMEYNKSNKYGILSKRNVEDLIHNTRQLDGQSDKKNPQDFALWKKAEPQHIMKWASPWSLGFPGWHLECTAMSSKYLGEKFDIHGGGMDLKFPHHECEIAQANACFNTNPANYWMHANMLTLNGSKMSKSTGNSVLPQEIISGNNKILSKAFSPSVIRFFMMQAHYRSILDLSDDALIASEKGHNKLMDAIENIDHLTSSDSSDFNVKDWIQNCYDAMNDDFNTPILIAQIFDVVKFINLVKAEKANVKGDDLNEIKTKLNEFVFDVLGLEKNKSNIDDGKIKSVIDILIELRDKARNDKNFELSDKIRDDLKNAGISLNDSNGKTDFTIN
tara:strand:+ start:37 stop:1509 length:1473 start_codon:yes stop_codon:yes gene_type:complete